MVALVGELNADGELEVVGIGSHPSRGLKKGVVVNIESTVQSIQRAIDEAQQMAGCRIHSAFVGIAGSHIRSLNSDGSVAIRDREVSSADLERVLEAAQAVVIPADQRVLHTLPQDYVIDNQEGIREPLGMSGVRLEAKVHVVTCAVNAAQNIEKCVRRCGLEVDDIILEQLASSYSVLTDDEKELGVCLIDIGGGTTGHCHFHRRGDPPHGSHSDCRRPGDQRHCPCLADTNPVCRRDQDSVCLCPSQTGWRRRDHQGSLRRRPATAGAVPTGSGRGC